MNKAVLKFVDFLDRHQQKITNDFIMKARREGGYTISEFDEITKRSSECRNIGRQLRVPEESWHLHGEVFVEFDILSNLLSLSSLTNKEAVTIIFAFLKKNMEAGICCEEAGAFDQKRIDQYPFTAITPEEVAEMIHQDTYRLLLAKPEEERTEKENQIVKELDDFTRKYPSDVQRYKEIHQQIAKHYFDKQDSFDEEDIAVVVEELRKMNLTEEYGQKIEKQLRIAIQGRTEKIVKRDTLPSPRKKETKAEPPRITLSKKESNTLYREIKKYYDPDTNTPTTYLDLPTIIYCLSLMRKLTFSEESIQTFLRNVEKENRKQERHPISLYVELYNKLKYYEDKLDIAEELSSIESILQEMFITTDTEYQEWKNLLEAELASCLSKISSRHEYELEESLKYKK